MINDFYQDFRRAHINTLIKHIVCDELIHDEKPADERPFNIRYKEARKAMSDNITKFLNASDSRESYLSMEQRQDMFYNILSLSIDDMFHLFFEAGLQSGLVFAIDLGFTDKLELNEKMEKKIQKNESILGQLLNGISLANLRS